MTLNKHTYTNIVKINKGKEWGFPGQVDLLCIGGWEDIIEGVTFEIKMRRKEPDEGRGDQSVQREPWRQERTFFSVTKEVGDMGLAVSPR